MQERKRRIHDWTRCRVAIRLKIGEVEVIALSDGTVPSAADDIVRNTNQVEIAALLSAADAAPLFEASMNAYLIHLGNRLMEASHLSEVVGKSSTCQLASDVGRKPVLRPSGLDLHTLTEGIRNRLSRFARGSWGRWSSVG
jgi:hypothetical protein